MMKIRVIHTRVSKLLVTPSLAYKSMVHQFPNEQGELKPEGVIELIGFFQEIHNLLKWMKVGHQKAETHIIQVLS